MGGPLHSPVLAWVIDPALFYCLIKLLERNLFILCDREAVFLRAPAAAGDRPVPRLRQGEGQQADGQVLRTVSCTHYIAFFFLVHPQNVTHRTTLR
jgi:hypothetical protein